MKMYTVKRNVDDGIANAKTHKPTGTVLAVVSIACGFDYLGTGGSTTWHDATKPFPKTHPCSSVLLGT